MFWNGFVFEVPLIDLVGDLAGRPIRCEDKVVGEITKAVRDEPKGVWRIYATLHQGASLPVRGGEDLEVSIGCKPAT